MISVAEASGRILARIGALSAEPVATADAAGRVLAGPVIAPIDSPPWDNSSMDGYAARSDDLTAAPVSLHVVDDIAAGAFPSRPIKQGEAARVMTGAPVPAGADSVIRREDTDDGQALVTIRLLRDVRKNIRPKADDFAAGETLFDRGESLGIAHVGAIAAAGLKSVSAFRRPRVALISTGDELVLLDEFSSHDAGRKIVSSNSITLSALVRDAGGEPVDLGIASDSQASIQGKLEQARDADLIITSAGISIGDHDHVRAAFHALGGVLDFWKVRMRPGAPLAFGMLQETPWIGLSGNPVSAIVTFELFVRPALRRMLGHRRLFRPTFPARVTEPVTLAAPLMHFLRTNLQQSDNGDYLATLARSQSSAVLTSMARSNALLILPGDRLEIADGEIHRAMPLSDVLATDELVLS